MTTIINIIVSLLAGTVGAVLCTPWTTRMGERSRARFAAERELRGVLVAYRQDLDFQRERVRTENSGYPPEFASLPGQEKLGEQALRLASQIAPRKRRLIEGNLTQLLGSATFAYCRSRMWVPDTARNQTIEQARFELALRRITLEPERYAEGYLPQLLALLNAPLELPAKYDATVALLDGMIDRLGS